MRVINMFVAHCAWNREMNWQNGELKCEVAKLNGKCVLKLVISISISA
jgi:hypothetical protein